MDAEHHQTAIGEKRRFVGQNSRGQLLIERKDEMRARGLASPDKADALMLAFLRGTGGVRLRV